MMTATLVWISCFDENSHEIKDVVESSFGFYLKSLFKMPQKENIFKFFFLTPMSFSLVKVKLMILLTLDDKRLMHV